LILVFDTELVTGFRVPSFNLCLILVRNPVSVPLF